MEKNRFKFWYESKNWNFWALSVNFFFDSAQIIFFQVCATSRNVSVGNLMEDFRMVATTKSSLKVRILHCQEQVLEESENQTCKSKTEVYDCAIETVSWNVKDLMDTLMQQTKTELIWYKLILSIETLSMLLKNILELLECSISGVKIETGSFSIESSYTNLNFLIVIFFEKVGP